MSISVLHRCPACGFEIEAWDDGHPYIRDDRGRARFYYHPCETEVRQKILSVCEWAHDKSPEDLSALLEKKSGNMTEFLCLGCCRRFKCDEDRQQPRCRKRGSKDVRDVMLLGGCACPKCGKGRFPDEPPFYAIS